MPQIISQNTEWTSGSTHVLSDVLQVATGATLKIDAGAVVSGGSIEVFGTLDAQGTSLQKVQFNSVNLDIVGMSNSPADMSIDNAVFQGGTFLAPTGNGKFGSFSLTNSVFRDVGGYAYVWYPTANDVISGNLFDGFGGFSIGTDGPQVLISHNTFLNIGPYISNGSGWSSSGWAGATIVDWAAYNNAQVIVDHNNFLDVGKPTLALPSGYNSSALTATNNYFGTNDSSIVSSMIFDKNDDLSSVGYITIAPILPSPDLTAPSWPTAPTVTAIGGSDSVVSGQPGDAVLAGTAKAGGTVTLRVGNPPQATLLGNAPVDGNGHWSYALSPSNIALIGQGPGKVIYVTATDAAGNPSVSVSSSSFSVDTTAPSAAPTVTAVKASPSYAVLGAGAPVTVTLGFSEAVTVAGGIPTLTLNNGGTATYASGSGTNALTFSYTVAGGQDVPDLAVAAGNLNGATVTNQAGNAAILDGAAANPVGTLAIEPSAIAGFDTTTNQPVVVVGQAYTGPVADLQNQYINITSDNLSVATATPNWFIHSGSGDDAIAVSSGTNVLDGGTGSNFLTGGNGTDTFFVDDRAAPADIWSTVNNFHGGDAATIWGVTAQDFGLTWVDGQGAAGFTGLTLHATAAGRPTASLTLAGYTQADLNNGRLSVLFGSDSASDSAYMYVHGNS